MASTKHAQTVWECTWSKFIFPFSFWILTGPQVRAISSIDLLRTTISSIDPLGLSTGWCYFIDRSARTIDRLVLFHRSIHFRLSPITWHIFFAHQTPHSILPIALITVWAHIFKVCRCSRAGNTCLFFNSRHCRVEIYIWYVTG